MRWNKINVIDAYVNTAYFLKTVTGIEFTFWVRFIFVCGKVLWKSGNLVGFCCWIWLWKSGLGLLQVWDELVVWLVDECLFCSQCVKRSPIEKPENNGFYYGFFYPHNAKKSIFFVMCYNGVTGKGNGNANRTGTQERTPKKINRFRTCGIITLSKGTASKGDDFLTANRSLKIEQVYLK